MNQETFWTFDTETTALDPVSDRIIEVAAVEIVDRRLTGRTFRSLVNPQGRPIAYESFRVHGITNEEVADAPPLATVYAEMMETIADSVLVIHNAPFDVEFIKAATERGEIPALSNAVIDSIDLAKKLWPTQAMSLDAIANRLGLANADRRKKHGALIDCVLLAQVWIRMLAMREEPREQVNLFEKVATPAQTDVATPQRRRPAVRI